MIETMRSMTVDIFHKKTPRLPNFLRTFTFFTQKSREEAQIIIKIQGGYLIVEKNYKMTKENKEESISLSKLY